MVTGACIVLVVYLVALVWHEREDRRRLNLMTPENRAAELKRRKEEADDIGNRY